MGKYFIATGFIVIIIVGCILVADWLQTTRIQPEPTRILVTSPTNYIEKPENLYTSTPEPTRTPERVHLVPNLLTNIPKRDIQLTPTRRK